MSRVQLEPAFVLHRRAYRETSLLVEAFSAAHGRVGLVARGARRPSSQSRALLQPFKPLLLSWTGRGELATLTGAESAGRDPELARVALVSALYVNELLVRLLHRNDPNPALFQSYRRAVYGLSGQCEGGPEPVLRVFEKRLLDAIGYGLVLDHDAGSGAGIDAGACYDYRREEGPRRTSPGASALGVAVSGHTLLALRAERIDGPDALRESKRLMRYLLAPLVGERPLHSRSLLPGGAGHGGQT